MRIWGFDGGCDITFLQLFVREICFLVFITGQFPFFSSFEFISCQYHFFSAESERFTVLFLRSFIFRRDPKQSSIYQHSIKSKDVGILLIHTSRIFRSPRSDLSRHRNLCRSSRALVCRRLVQYLLVQSHKSRQACSWQGKKLRCPR